MCSWYYHQSHHNFNHIYIKDTNYCYRFTWRWCDRSFCMGKRHEYWCRIWRGCWANPTPRKFQYGSWIYPPLEDVMEEAGLHEMETYVSDLQNKVAQYIATRPIMCLCLVENRRPGPRVEMRWREYFQTGNWEEVSYPGGGKGTGGKGE